MLYAVGTIGNLSLYGADGPEMELCLHSIYRGGLWAYM